MRSAHGGASNAGNPIDAACTASHADHEISRTDLEYLAPLQLGEEIAEFISQQSLI